MEFKSNEEMVEYLVEMGYIRSERVKEAFLKVDRKVFVPAEYKDSAYVDFPIRIGANATISAPHMVAMMTELLKVEKGNKILEIGAGSCWQACILGYLVGKEGLVITVEIDKQVYEFGKKNLEKIGMKNVRIINADGSCGYPEFAPYDRILITAACPKKIPKEIVKQLSENGRVVAPVEEKCFDQWLVVGEKINGKFKTRKICSVSFVRLIGKCGFKSY